MKCFRCGKKLSNGESGSLVIGLSCQECIPRGIMTNFEIRLTQTEDDRQYVLDFLDRLFGETEFIEFDKWYNVRDMQQVIAITSENLRIGLAVFTIEQQDPSLMTLLTINVDEMFTRRGVGTSLAQWVKNYAAEVGMSRIRVPISNDDLVSYVFWHRQDFRLFGLDIGLCVKRHGQEMAGFWNIPCRDELYLEWLVPE
ncbi:MAG TPA: GNAT family N-acetyltransferase [Dehalococcoidia bacterium]|nr:GNAT family N-acetyltransferase [Dehalococcoidia bacterium]